jgi:hypothetical protein
VTVGFPAVFLLCLPAEPLLYTHTDTSAPVGPALGYWVKEGVGLVVHFPLEDVAKINTP